jgi:type IV pilus assembly protein PilE
VIGDLGAMRKATGFSLLELMIVLAVIAITLAWAIPSYQDSVRKARRGEAMSNLREFEVCAARAITVDFNNPDLTPCEPDEDDYYSYTVDPVSRDYTITAEPKGDQENDKCGTLSLTSQGDAEAIKGSEPVPGCWLSGQTSSS